MVQDKGEAAKRISILQTEDHRELHSDFYCAKANLVIELDGGQHYSTAGKVRDRDRDDFMAGVGLKVLRFSDREVYENFNGLLETIWKNLDLQNLP